MKNIMDPQHYAKEGASAYQHGRYLDAANAFHKARITFESNLDWLSAAEMANNCSVAFLQAGEAERAFIELEGVGEAFAEVGDDLHLGMTIGNQAAALEALDRYDEALQAYQTSAELLGKAGEDQLRASAMQALSALQLRTGRRIQALVSMQQGIEGLKKPTVVQKLAKNLLNFPFDMLGKTR
jgi:tetratricopeptide (TPR) repeat protein